MSEEGHNYFFHFSREMPWKSKKRISRVKQVEIVQGYLALYISFKDALDVQEKFTGRVYRNPTISSMNRLAEILPKYCKTRIIRDGMTFIYLFERGDTQL
jgi:hypothetical protein